MARRRIWEIGCLGMDTVLAASFHPDELTTIDRELARAYQIPDHPGVNVPVEVLIYAMAHQVCHRENPTSRSIERRLNVMYEPMIKSLEDQCEIDVLAECHSATHESQSDLAGRAWALLTDPRPKLRKHDQVWVQGLVIRAMLHWMSSKRERFPQEEAGS